MMTAWRRRVVVAGLWTFTASFGTLTQFFCLPPGYVVVDDDFELDCDDGFFCEIDD